MAKNLNYENNVLQAFTANYLENGASKFVLGKRRHAREDGIFTDKNGKVFSAELTKITNESTEERNNFLLDKRGVAEPYTAYSSNEAIRAINKKNSKYDDQNTRILVLDANCCVSFDWIDYWQPVIECGKKTDFVAIYAIQTNGNDVKILTIKNS